MQLTNAAAARGFIRGGALAVALGGSATSIVFSLIGAVPDTGLALLSTVLTPNVEDAKGA